MDRENEFFGDIKSDNTEEINTSSTGINYGDRSNKDGMKNIIIAVSAGAVFAAVLLLLLSPRKDSRDTNFAEIPTLSQPTGPIRIEPTEQMPLPSEVFESATIYNTQEQPVIGYQPAPIPPAPIVKPAEPAPIPAKSVNKLPKKVTKPAPKAKAEVKKAPAPVAKPVTKVAAKPATKSQVNLPEKELVEKTTGVPGEVEMALVEPGTTPTGAWNVQLVSTSSETAAQNEWENLSKKYPAILGDKSHTISQTEINGKTYYRLRVSNIATSEQATEICNQLKTYQLSCFVVK